MAELPRLDALSRERPLSDEETAELARLVSREPHEPIYRKWTMEDRRALATAARERGGLKAYAETTGRTYASCQTELANIKRDRRRRGIAFVGRFFYDGEAGTSSELDRNR